MTNIEPTLITELVVRNIFDCCLKDAAKLVPTEKWSIRYRSLKMGCAKKNYAEATPNGDVLISNAFLGTTAVNALKASMLHELAHLIVGIEHHHNKRFWAIEARLTVGLGDVKAERIQVQDNNQFKYRLIAYSEYKVYDFGGAFRRTKKYTEYDPAKRKMRVNRDDLLRFEYVDYFAELPDGIINDLNF